MSAIPIALNEVTTALNKPTTLLGEDPLFAVVTQALVEQGYVILPAALPEPVAQGVLDALANIHPEEFNRAGVGRGDDATLNTFVRRDKIAWIEQDVAASQPWLDWMQALQTYINRHLYMGLFSFESHFAIYKPGDFYQKHVDAFKGESNRVLSVVTYLNRDWQPDQGGELVIYNPHNELEATKVTPNFGTVVIFLSEEFPHEVLPAKRTRYSVAGWFRVNGSTLNRVDPPQ